MADNAKSKIHYDDFIANVQPDPAKPESTIMLSGFIGRGGDGVVRIYPDPSLGSWYDVPEADLVHSIAVPDSKLGGSYVWVRAAADIKPGSVSTGTGGAAAPAAAAAAPAAQAAPNFTIGAGCTFICAQPGGGLPQPTPATHCFICPPLTQDCTVATACSQQCTTPLAGCLPVQTVATACSQHCTTPLAGCLPVQTAATVCTQINQCLQPTPTAHLSLATVCTQFCPTLHTGCLTVPINCFPITQPQICTIAISPNCPPPAIGTPVQQQLGLAAAAIRPQPTPTVQTHCFICPPHQTLDTLCTLPPGCPITQQCSQATFCSQLNQCGHHPTAATICTETCNTLLVGCGHHPTAATICTETCNTLLVGCWQTLPVNCWQVTQPQICNIAVSPNCPPPPPGTPVQQPGVMAAAMQPTPTAQTHCFVCPPITQQQPCGQHTIPATVCWTHAAPACPPHPTVGMFCTELCPSLIVCPTRQVQCLVTQPQVCTIVASPNCPPVGPGTPVQQIGTPAQHPAFAAQALQPTPSAVNQCGVHTALPACQPSVNVICPTPSAVHQCGGHTALPACQPSVNVICPTPSAVHQCGVFTPYGR
jgi:hypothetical protein